MDAMEKMEMMIRKVFRQELLIFKEELLDSLGISGEDEKLLLDEGVSKKRKAKTNDLAPETKKKIREAINGGATKMNSSIVELDEEDDSVPDEFYVLDDGEGKRSRVSKKKLDEFVTKDYSKLIY